MSLGPAGELAYRGWVAEGWDEVRAIWEDLAPRPDTPASFRGLALNPQQRGWVFERWVMEAFRQGGATTQHRYLNPMTGSGTALEEIDGIVFDGWQAFLIEAKYERDKVNIDPIFRLHLMAEQRPVGTLGLVFSMSGFTPAAFELSERLRPIRVLLFDLYDLELAHDAGESIMSMVRKRWVRAVQSGRPHFLNDRG